MSSIIYEPLCNAKPELGSIGVLEWDSDVFGFAVADYRASEVGALLADIEEFRRCLGEWAASRKVELVGCAVPGTEQLWCAALPAAGFHYVDTTLIYSHDALQRVKFKREYKVRMALPEDQPAVEQIAERSFHVGRYHADPFFPEALARLRFRRWLTQAFAAQSETSRVLVIGEPGSAVAFSHTYLEADNGRITIGGVDESKHKLGLGPAIFLGTFQALRDAGMRRLQSKLSASNVGAMNCAAFGSARFSQPEHVFHWHAPEAEHLLTLRELAAQRRG